MADIQIRVQCEEGRYRVEPAKVKVEKNDNLVFTLEAKDQQVRLIGDGEIDFTLNRLSEAQPPGRPVTSYVSSKSGFYLLSIANQGVGLGTALNLDIQLDPEQPFPGPAGGGVER